MIVVVQRVPQVHAGHGAERRGDMRGAALSRHVLRKLRHQPAHIQLHER